MRAHIVPHTHWDREWYLTFQEFRFKLVRLIDSLLEIMEQDPEYRYFTLDGQAIILEDYLEIKPENRPRLEKLIREGRILIGPWYVLPDEFYVSGEALIRNLQRGIALCEQFGGAMMVGYVPDQFGHIAQLPQIFRGFGITEAVLWRGVGGECNDAQFDWEAPDGSRVTTIYLADGYGNAASLPVEPEELRERLEQIAASLKDFLSTEHMLFMNGSDHLMPQPRLPRLLEEIAGKLSMETEFSTLPRYIAAVKAANPRRPLLKGELRSGERAPLLVGCASARIKQKQRNRETEILLEKYAEPLAAWAFLFGAEYPAGYFRESWRLLLQNHPHDSICGCSNDQVHREIETRYDWSSQVARLVKEDKFSFLAGKVDTSWFKGRTGALVYNPHPRTLSGPVELELPETEDEPVRALLAEDGAVLPVQPVAGEGGEYFTLTITPFQARALLGYVSGREFQGLYFNGVRMAPPENGELKVDFLMGPQPVGELDMEDLKTQALQLLKDKSIKKIKITARQGGNRVLFMAKDVPGCGWSTYVPAPASQAPEVPATDLKVSRGALENRYYRVSVNGDGTLDIYDKESGLEFRGMNRLVDGGDRGDLYTYDAPEEDRLVAAPARHWHGGRVRVKVIEEGPVRASLRITGHYRLPQSLAANRKERSRKSVLCPFSVTVSLLAGQRGIHVETVFDNRACDHRLRAYFPAPFKSETACADGHFHVVERPAQPPAGDYSAWAEKPCGAAQQKDFVSISNGEWGLAVINHGLPEYEVIPGEGQTVIALTLLRSVGWLSRDDLASRPGHAGPAVETPEGQCPGEHRFRYTIVPHRGDWREGRIKELASLLTAPFLGTAKASEQGELPSRKSLLTLEPAEMVLSALQRSRDGSALLVRLFNCSPEEQEAVLETGFSFKEVAVVNFLEQPADLELKTEGAKIRFTARPYQIITLKLGC
ncbi:MAG: glycoside hydrolase family 38 C-terminal domain-containing protein [Dethiobacteria bacterium]